MENEEASIKGKREFPATDESPGVKPFLLSSDKADHPCLTGQAGKGQGSKGSFAERKWSWRAERGPGQGVSSQEVSWAFWRKRCLS